MDFISKIQLPNGNDYLLKTETISTASGSIANFTTSLALPLVAMSAEIVAQQASGTPTPSSPLPITGFSSVGLTHTGKNLLDPVAYSSFLQSDGKYRGTANALIAVRSYLGAYIGKQLTFSAYVDLTVSPTPTNVKVAVNINGVTTYGNDINSGNAGYSSVTFTPQSENDFVLITFGSAGGNSYTFYDIQLEASSARTAYEPYNVETKTIALGQTVYGGVLDAKNGKATITHDFKIFDGSSDENWFISSNNTYYGIEIGIDSMVADTLISNLFEGIQGAPSSNHLGINNSTRYVRVRPSADALDLQAFKTWLSNNNLQVCYELATPIEITGLTPANFTTIAGENNIFSDCGDISVSYFNSGASDTEKLIKTVTYTKNEVDDIVDNHHDAFSSLTDTTISSPTNGQIIKYNGTKWVNADNSANGVSLDGSTMQIDNTNVQTFINVLFDALKDCTKNLTASGSIATFTTSLELPLVVMSAEIVAQQAGTGTPSPSNPRSISGFSSVNVTRCGVNLYPIYIGRDVFMDLGATHTSDNDVLTINVTTSGNIKGVYSNNFLSELSNITKILSGQITYSFEIKADVNTTVRVGYENGGTTTKNITTEWQRITITSNFDKTRTNFVIYNMTNYTSTIQVRNFQIEVGSTATAYEPYNAETKTIALGQTVYGGVLDAINGKLVVTHARVDLGDINWTNLSTTNKFIYTNGTLVPTAKATPNSVVANMICEIYPTLSRSEIKYAAPYETGIAIDQTGNIIISDQSKTWATIDEAKADLRGHYVVYELATPIEITGLTPANFTTFAGEQNIFSDSGDISVSFKQGIQEYIDAKIAETQA